MAAARVRVRLLTAPGSGAVAVIEVRGAGAVQLARRILGGRSPDAVPRLVEVRGGDGAAIDRGLAFVRSDPAGGEVVELHLHGGRATVEATLDALRRAGAEVVDGCDAPVDRLLRGARAPAQLALALAQQAALGRWGSFAGWLAACAGDRSRLAAAWRRSLGAAPLWRSCPLLLCGAKNAGKSTLMNRLLQDERVLAGDQPGLTRDAVREPVELGGYPYLLIDTPGLGEAVDELDRAALAAGEHLRRHAVDAVRLLLIDGTVGPTGHDAAVWSEAPDRTLVVRSKADLGAGRWDHGVPEATLALSCLDPGSAHRVRAAVGAALCRQRRLPRSAEDVARAAGREVLALDAGQLAALRAALDRCR